MHYFFIGFILLVISWGVYAFFITPRRWMREYGDGVYSPLRKTYINAAKN